jgi:hypothetical protein
MQGDVLPLHDRMKLIEIMLEHANHRVVLRSWPQSLDAADQRAQPALVWT